MFTSPPRVIQKLAAKVVAPLARRVGYRAFYPEYLQDSFWLERVEQPLLRQAEVIGPPKNDSSIALPAEPHVAVDGE